jgi:cell wall-associated NlpC family hydrolase
MLERTKTGSGSSDYNLQYRQNIVEYAVSQQGAKYKYAGRSPKTGFDCSGFVYYVFDAFNVQLTPNSRDQEQEGRTIALKEAKPGDLVFFRRSKAGSVFHVALVVDNTSDGITVVHSTSSRGVIVENITKSSYWKSKVTTARDVVSR